MKKISFILFFLLTIIYVNAQINTNNVDNSETSGYFLNPAAIPNGFIVTDNYNNAIYKISDGNIQKLISSPGCGRYFNISPDKKMIGFKLINENALQTPAIYNIAEDEIILLHEAVSQCGQVVFTANNSPCFTIGQTLFILNKNDVQTYYLGAYSNIIAVSPDAHFVVYSNAHDELVLRNLLNNEEKLISTSGRMSVYPQWAPDGKKIIYQSDNVFVYDLENNTTYDLGQGLAPKWSPDATHIVYYKTIVTNDMLTHSDIFLSDYKGEGQKKLTQTDSIFEMQPSFVDEQTIVYHTYKGKGIETAEIDNNLLYDIKSFYVHEDFLDIDFYNTPQNKQEVRIPGTIPYVHQVYDTPNSHYGYGSCAPATAVMAFAYFNRLPPWPIQCGSPYSHTSNYGAYVSEKYTLNTYYYENVSQTSGGDNAYGGYGFMWGLGSPSSKMIDYITGHYFNSIQYWTSSCTFTRTKNEIDASFPHSMCVMLTSSGHLILCQGYVVGQQTLIFSDPYGNKNTPGYPSYDGQNAYYDWPGHNNGYQNLDYNGSYGYIAWTITSQGSHVAYNDTIIDDLFYKSGFHMNNSQNTSHMRYFHDQNSGYQNHFWYTTTMATLSDICWVTWEPNLPCSGQYEVFAFIPSSNANATGARYKIKHASGDTLVVINQNNYNNMWVSLGTYAFDTSLVSSVYLGDSTGVSGQSVAFDAVWWSFRSPPVAALTTNSTNICMNDTLVFYNQSSYADSFEWYFQGGVPGFSNDFEPEVVYHTSGIYNVSLIAHGPYGADTLTLNAHIHVNENPVAQFVAYDTAYLLPDAVVVFLNNTIAADNFLWNFGNGTTSNDLNPYCIYNSAGDYTVSLIAYNSLCGTDTLVKENYIHVLSNSGIEDVNLSDISVYPNPFSDFLYLITEKSFSFQLFDALGKKLMDGISDGQTVLKTLNMDEGSYFLLIERENEPLVVIRLIKE
ncbi:MAG: T9SS type A sorting domain-containing protein [Bacteroidales bacterium]|nr:T9SS type A sorting domain-containing protein [Bacteroidales bacterium]